MDIDDEIVFNMKDLSDIIDELNPEKRNFDSLVTKKVAENVKEWVKINPHHNFPKSNNAWERLLFSQFGNITIIIDPIALMSITDEKKNNYIDQITILKERINKYLSKKKNAELYNTDYNKSIKIIRSFCRFKYYVNCYDVLKELYNSNLLNKDSQIVLTFWDSKKRCRVVDTNSEDYEFYDNCLNISSIRDVKKQKKK